MEVLGLQESKIAGLLGKIKTKEISKRLLFSRNKSFSRGSNQS